MKRSKGYLSKTLKSLRSERRITPADFVREFQIGERIRISPVPYYRSGQIPHRRYKNLVGEVIERRGRGYVVRVKLGNEEKKLILLPIHMERV
ncbi:MAG: 50S ribosomal protein L21e [Candidatus Micrarchaeota archaeon]|nr:50S ribosomal protein L21e [Candidatus Micrarchaeota archaeon]MCX8154347.1 50S ribosomal protein L21e [Candidatus Micrarchaeota archaeon]